MSRVPDDYGTTNFDEDEIGEESASNGEITAT